MLGEEWPLCGYGRRRVKEGGDGKGGESGFEVRTSHMLGIIDGSGAVSEIYLRWADTDHDMC